jgi:hypothetical protein
MEVMSVSVLRLAPAFLLLGLNLMAAESPSTLALLSQSRDLVARGSLDDAVAVLEKSLENAPEADLPAILDQLRKFYVVAINENRKAGRYEQADHYSHNLKVMDSGSDAPDAGVMVIPEAVPTDRPAPAQAKPEQTIPRISRHEPPADSLAVPMAREESQASRDQIPARAKAGSQSLNREVPQAEIADNQEPRGNLAQFDIAEADNAFSAKKYTEAGAIYEKLNKMGKLPDSRRVHLAYCRSAALVARINQNPKSAAEWSQIEAELREIMTIQPDFWFAEYLRDLVNERSKTALSSATSGKSGTQLASNGGMIGRAARQISSININPLKR